MKQKLAALLLALCCAAIAPAQSKNIVLIAGDQEYRSEESMPALAKILAARGFHCTIDIRRIAAGNERPGLGGIWVHRFEPLAGMRVDPLTRNQHLVLLHGLWLLITSCATRNESTPAGIPA